MSDTGDTGSGAARLPPWIPRSIVLFWGGGAALFVAWWLLNRLQGLLVTVLVSLFLAFALEPAVNSLHARGWRRGTATAVMFLVLTIATAGFALLMGRLLVDQVSELIDEAPTYIEQLEDWANDTFDATIDTDTLLAEFQEGGAAQDLAQRLAGNLLTVGATVVGWLFRFLTIGLFTFYLVADGPRLRQQICSVLPPQHQLEVLRAWNIAVEKTGGYLYSRAILGLISMVAHWVAFTIIGVPFALPLAVWVGLTSQFIPVVGTYLAGTLPLLIAVLDDPVSALWVLGVIVVYQQIENYLLQPRITAHTVEIHPAIAFGTVIAGASILGPIGALLAVPAGATLQTFVSTYIRRHELVDEAAERRPRAGA